MRKIYYDLFIFVLIATSCSSGKEISPDQRQREIEQSKFASEEYAVAVKRAENHDPAGFLKLYAIASDDLTYTVEYSEVAGEKLRYFLHSKTELWIKTFSKVDIDKFKAYLKRSGIGVSKLPNGVASDEQFKEEIFVNLKKMKGDKKETVLIDYILGLCAQKRH